MNIDDLRKLTNSELKELERTIKYVRSERRHEAELRRARKRVENTLEEAGIKGLYWNQIQLRAGEPKLREAINSLISEGKIETFGGPRGIEKYRILPLLILVNGALKESEHGSP